MIAFLRKLISGYRQFEGRVSRSEYRGFLFNIFFTTLLLCAGEVLVLLIIDSYELSFVDGFEVLLISPIIFIFLAILPIISFSVRRLHDAGKPGWFLLIGIIPAVGLLLFFYLVLKKGDVGINHYGSAPKIERTYHFKCPHCQKGLELNIKERPQKKYELQCIKQPAKFNATYFLIYNSLSIYKINHIPAEIFIFFKPVSGFI